MCGRYVSARTMDELGTLFGITDAESIPAPDWNVAPTKDVPVVVTDGDGRRCLTTMRWGLVPAWAADPSVGPRMINARVESVHERAAFRDAVVRRRCLLPADGWYEWAAPAPGQRQPYFVAPPDGTPLAFAGLWDTWVDAEGRPLHTVAVLTGDAPPDLRWLHERAPVVVDAAEWSRWLDPRLDDVPDLLRPTPSGLVRAHPVGVAVGDVRAQGPQLTEPVEVVEQPTLF